MEANDFDPELQADIQELVASGVIEKGGVEHGVALQAIDRGYASLSDPQRFTFDSVIVPALQELRKVDSERQPKSD